MSIGILLDIFLYLSLLDLLRILILYIVVSIWNVPRVG